MNEVTAEFVRLFNEEEDFYECHEIFEAAWKASADPVEKVFYKALVQVATAQFKLKKGILLGMRKLFDYAMPALETLPDTFHGIDIVRLRRDFHLQIQSLPDLNCIEEGEHARYGLGVIKIHTSVEDQD
jgi:predicted metal-dependent hydrolase